MKDQHNGFNVSLDLNKYISCQIIPSEELQQQLDLKDNEEDMLGFTIEFISFVSNLLVFNILFENPLIYQQTIDANDVLKITINEP